MQKKCYVCVEKDKALVDDSIYANEEDSDTDEPINTSPTGLEGEDC